MLPLHARGLQPCLIELRQLLLGTSPRAPAAGLLQPPRRPGRTEALELSRAVHISQGSVRIEDRVSGDLGYTRCSRYAISLARGFVSLGWLAGVFAFMGQ